MNFKKFNGTIWETVQHKVYGSGTEQLASFPSQIQASGEPLTDYTVYGNTVQNGTPTPEAPVDVVGCGEKTENLFDITAFVQGITPNRCTTSYDSTTNTLTINATGDDAHTGNANSYHIPVIGGKTYTLSWDTNTVNGRVYVFENGLTDSSHIHDRNSAYKNMSIAMRSDTTFVIVRVGCDRANSVKTYSNIALNLGSTALPYEPYGYKIPVTSGGVTTNLYLDAPLGAGDTLTYTDTGIAIPTSDGDNIISFGTTVQPSAMSATFKGWHPVSSPKTYDGNDWS